MSTLQKIAGFFANLTSNGIWHHPGNESFNANGDWVLRDELERQLIERATRRPY